MVAQREEAEADGRSPTVTCLRAAAAAAAVDRPTVNCLRAAAAAAAAAVDCVSPVPTCTRVGVEVAAAEHGEGRHKIEEGARVPLGPRAAEAAELADDVAPARAAVAAAAAAATQAPCL